MADDVEVKFGASIEGVNQGIAQVQEAVEGLSGRFRRSPRTSQSLARRLPAAFAVEKIAEFAESMAALGTETNRAAQILGVPTEQIGALGLVAKASGSDLGSLENAFSRMSRNIVEGSDQTKRALDALGISMTAFKNMTPTDQLGLLAEKFSESENGAQKMPLPLPCLVALVLSSSRF